MRSWPVLMSTNIVPFLCGLLLMQRKGELISSCTSLQVDCAEMNSCKDGVLTLEGGNTAAIERENRSAISFFSPGMYFTVTGNSEMYCNILLCLLDKGIGNHCERLYCRFVVCAGNILEHLASKVTP